MSNTATNYLPLYFPEWTPDLEKQAKDELCENPTTIEQSLDELKTLLEKDVNYTLDDSELLVFLRARKYDVEKTFTLFQSHVAIIKKHDVIFKDFDFLPIEQYANSDFMSFLPKRDADGCAIFVCFLAKWIDLGEDIALLIRLAVFVLLDILHCPITQITGLKLIIDHSEAGVKKLLSVPKWINNVATDLLQFAFPIRIKEYHCVNTGMFFQYSFPLFRLFLSKKMSERMFIHGHDLESLQKYFPLEILPQEFGGQLSEEEMNEWTYPIKESHNPISDYIKKIRNEL